jgi:hypothetical protein
MDLAFLHAWKRERMLLSKSNDMNQAPFFFGNEDLLKLLIKECVREVLMELSGKVPYPSAPVSINEKKILTRKQAAAYLQVTPNTLTRYVRQGKLLPAIINGKYRFFESDLIKFLNNKAA